MCYDICIIIHKKSAAVEILCVKNPNVTVFSDLCNRSIVWLDSSVVECSHGKRETLGSSPGRATFFFRPCDIWWPVWVRARAASSNLKETVSSVPAWFRADSGTNLIKQGENVTGRSCGSIAQW